MVLLISLSQSGGSDAKQMSLHFLNSSAAPSVRESNGTITMETTEQEQVLPRINIPFQYLFTVPSEGKELE